jgi:hypothetical protein
MKQTLYVLLFQLIAINTVDAQVLKKIARGIKEGASGAFEFSKNTVSDAVEFGRIKSIYKDINEKKFDDAAVKLNDFKAKYPDNYVHKYLSYLLFNSEDYSSKNYDLAYASIDSLITYHYEFFDEKEKEKLCKEIMLCGQNLTKQNEIVQSKLLNVHRSSESAISYFIEKYPKSYLIDSAINIRYTLRYETAKAVNNLEAYTEFIIQNPNSPQFNEARYNQSVLAFEKAQNEHTLSSYQYFLRNYSGIGLLDKKAKLALKNLKMSEIYNGYGDIIKKYGQLIRRFTFEFSKTDGSYNREDGIIPFTSTSSDYRYQSDKLVSTAFTVEGSTINTAQLLDTFTKLIDDFNNEYPNSKELYFLNQIKEEILTIKERLDFINVVKIADFYAEMAKTNSADPLDRFINTYPKSIYAIYAKNKKDIQTKIVTKKQELIRKSEEKEALALNQKFNNSPQNGSIQLTYSCKNCFGYKYFSRKTTKVCSNCSYWTDTQRYYNYCSVCKNQREIVLKAWKEQCKVCNAKGTLTAKVSNEFQKLIKFALYDNSEQNIFDSKYSFKINSNVSLEGVISYDIIHFYDYQYSLDLYLYSNGSAKIVSEGLKYTRAGDYYCSWEILEGKFSLKAELKYKNGGDLQRYDLNSYR